MAKWSRAHCPLRRRAELPAPALDSGGYLTPLRRRNADTRRGGASARARRAFPRVERNAQAAYFRRPVSDSVQIWAGDQYMHVCVRSYVLFAGYGRERG